MTDQPTDSTLDKALDAGKKAKAAWEIGAFLVTAGTAVLAFVSKVGGPKQFLVEVAFIGFAAYVALFLVLIPLAGLVAGLERATGRVTTDQAQMVIAVVGALGGAVLVRFGLFAPGVSEDLDGIGTAFGVVVGVTILAAPFILLWYVKGSSPKTSQR